MITIDFTNHYSEALEMLTQWNANQTLMIRGLSTQTTPVIAFSNRASQTAVAVQARTVTGGYVCDIPNGLLTKPYTIYVDVRVSDGTGIKSIERGRIRVRHTSKPDDYEYVENITLVDITSFIADIDTVKSEFNSIKSMVGGPSTAGTKAAMTDTSKVYVYTGSETGMVNGNWYYHDGTNWVSGGVYNAIAVDTDKTLSVDDMAADAAAAGSIIEVGSTQPSSEANKLWIDPSADEIEIPEMSDLKIVEDKVDDLKSDLGNVIDVTHSANFTNPAETYNAVINDTTGAITPDNYYRCSAKIPCAYGETLYIVYANSQGKAVIRKTANDKIAFYQADNTFISIGYNADSYTVPENAAYCVEQGYNNQMRDGLVGIFKQPLSELGTVWWIPYSETKRIKDSYTPEAVNEELDEHESRLNDLDAVILAPSENLLDWSKIVFTQAGLSTTNLISNFFPLEENTTYTLKYDGAVDQNITCYIRFYSENSVSHIGQAQFSFKVGEVTFTTVANTVKAEIYVYKAGGITPETFPMSNGMMVYGANAPISSVPYKLHISADSFSDVPDRLYCASFEPLKTMAHMGQSFYFPHNTIWSWLGAKKAGFDYIECDLQVTADNEIVIIHDPDMRRYGGTASQTVESLTLAQLQEFDAGSWFNKRYEGTKFPVFDDFVGIAKSLGMKLALDCKTINTNARVDAVLSILRKWGMEEQVIWIVGFSIINYVWSVSPNAKIMWATASTLVNGSFSDTVGGWFAGMTNQWDASKKQTKTITIDVNGVPTEVVASVPADGVWFGITQDYTVSNDYGLSDLQLTGKYAKAYGVHYGLYAIDSDDDVYNYVTSIPELEFLTSNRTTVQAATCRKYGIGVSDRPQNIGAAELP